MGYLALYRKYRPNNFDDVYGQEEIVTVIKNAIVNNKISHAYLFSGPRGTGKTTIAKIIARVVNCENVDNGKPCGKCFNCMNFMNSNDIVEIDAASNNGVDEIRELRDKVNLVPSNSKYKVYIIDEVHMLTNQAFNALLKTLEEPPTHIIFILATTEPHKIPLTISSRCQKFRFSKIDDKKIVDRLKNIASIENIVCEDDAFFEIARLSDGCMRDAINMFDQLASYSNNNIVMQDVCDVNGSVSYECLNELLENIANNNKTKIIELVDSFDKSGKDIGKFIEEFIVYIKDIILYKNADFLSNITSKNDCIKKIVSLFSDELLYSLVDNLNDVQNKIKLSSHGSVLFMTSLLNFSEKINKKVNDSEKISDKIISREIIVNNNMENATCRSDVNKENVKIDIDGRINNALAGASKDILKEIKNEWNNLNGYLIDDENSIMAGILKDCDVVVASYDYLIISCNFDSIVSRINLNIDKVEKLLVKVFKRYIRVIAISNDEWNRIKIEYISNIKKGIKYNFIDLNEKNGVIEKKTPVDDLIDLVGDSVIVHSEEKENDE